MIKSCIYYPTTGKPTAGGQFVNESHVIALRAAGIRAYLLLCSPDAEKHGFPTQAYVLRWHQGMSFHESDVIVVPEPWKQGLEFFAATASKKIIHCQNPFYMFHAFETIEAVSALGYQAMLSCSYYTTEKVRHFGYQNPIYTVRPFVPDYFKSMESVQRKLQIAYMPRKRANEAIYIKGLFKSLYPQYRQIEWVAVENRTREQCAPILQESAIFIALSFTEGLGLPPLEAMAAGCLVAGFHGQGGIEYARKNNGFWVDEGDYDTFAAQIARAIETALNPEAFEIMQSSAIETANQFSQPQFTKQLMTAWQSILGNDYERFILDTN